MRQFGQDDWRLTKPVERAFIGLAGLVPVLRLMIGGRDAQCRGTDRVVAVSPGFPAGMMEGRIVGWDGWMDAPRGVATHGQLPGRISSTSFVGSGQLLDS